MFINLWLECSVQIAFINLTHHKKSGSSDWFIKEIKREFHVGEFTYDSDPSCVLDILDYKSKYNPFYIFY